MKKVILVTGAAGFIGFSVCRALLEKKSYSVIGIDNMNNYYDVELKKARLDYLSKISKDSKSKWFFKKVSIDKYDAVKKIFKKFKPTIVINLAAQAGVRYSLTNPMEYVNSNLVGFQNIIECCRNSSIENFIYASSSSVYGGNEKIPFSENDPVNHPISLYASTKRSNELIAHSYSHLYDIPSTGLRFFTVYGPWGRPDMAPMLFTKAILNKEPINIFNNGNLSRDFTYIDDVVEVISRLIKKPAKSDKNFNKSVPNLSTSWSKHRLFNVGNKNPIKIMDFIKILEDNIGLRSKKIYKSMQAGDVTNTYADTKLLEEWIKYAPNTPIEKGVREFIIWFKNYYKYC